MNSGLLCYYHNSLKTQTIALVKQFCYLVATSCLTLCNPTGFSMPGFPVPYHFLEFAKFMSIELVMPSNHLILCCLVLLPSIFPSIKVFSSESTPCIRWPKYWSFNYNISSSNEYSGLISFRMDWFDLLIIQGTLKSLLQHHNSKVSTLWHLAFVVQLSHLNNGFKFIPPTLYPVSLSAF